MYHITAGPLKRSHHCCGCGHAYLQRVGTPFQTYDIDSGILSVSRVSVNAWKSTLYIIPGIGCSSSVEGKIPCTVIFVTDQCRSQKNAPRRFGLFVFSPRCGHVL